MLNLKHFQWNYATGSKMYELEFSKDYWPDLDPAYFLSKLATTSTPMQYNYFEIVLVIPSNSSESSMAYVELCKYVPISTVTHPLQVAFEAVTPSFTTVPSIKPSSFTSASEAYDKFMSENKGAVYHIKHYPLRGDGIYHTLSSMMTLGLTKRELIEDEPFNLLSYRMFNEYFGYNGNHGGNGHQGSCSYVIGETGLLPSGIFRKIS